MHGLMENLALLAPKIGLFHLPPQVSNAMICIRLGKYHLVDMIVKEVPAHSPRAPAPLIVRRVTARTNANGPRLSSRTCPVVHNSREFANIRTWTSETIH